VTLVAVAMAATAMAVSAKAAAAVRAGRASRDSAARSEVRVAANEDVLVSDVLLFHPGGGMRGTMDAMFGDLWGMG